MVFVGIVLRRARHSRVASWPIDRACRADFAAV
jgi:hypothetical protein